MREDHGFHQADPARQPRSAKVRERIQDVHEKEEDRQLVFGDSESPEEPVRNQRVRQQAAAKTVDREKARQTRNFGLGLWGDLHSLAPLSAPGKLYFR